MATTIQLKTGTGSAVPANLTQGEVAINIDNGLVYYGSGSGNVTKKLEEFANITASGNINTTGIYKVDGVNAIDYSSNTHLFGSNSSYTKLRSTVGVQITAPITASGDISASGDLTINNAIYREVRYWEATARADCDNDTNWQGPNSFGIISRQDWNQDYGDDYDLPAATAFHTESRSLWNTGWRIPPDCSASIEGFDIYLNPNDSPDSGNQYDTDFGFSCSLWYSNPEDFAINHWDNGNSPPPDGTTGNTGFFYQRHAGTVTDAQISKGATPKLFKFNMLHVSQSFTPILIAPGGMVFPRMKTTSNSEGLMNLYWMVKWRKIKP